MALTDTAVRNAKPAEKPYKLTHGKGLYLLVNAIGKYWRLDYRFAGKRKTLALGVYPDVTLAKARERRDDARKLLAGDTDPSLVMAVNKRAKLDGAQNTFEALAREWYAKKLPTWAPTTAQKVIRQLEKDIFPWIGNRPIKDIAAPELLATLRRIESRRALEL